MKKFKITIQAEIVVSFDEKSDEFKQLMKGYRKVIDSHATHQSISENIASVISRYGITEAIECVGIVNHNGKKQHNSNFNSLINVDCDTDINGCVDFEVHYTEEL